MKYINLSLVVLLVMALSFNVYAADISDVTNNTAAVYGFEFIFPWGSSDVYTVYSNELSGTTAYWSIESPYLYEDTDSINMYITLANPSDMYIVLTYPYSTDYFPDLINYYNSDESFVAYNAVYWAGIVFDSDTLMGVATDSGTVYFEGDLYYISFKDIPVGTYTVNFPAALFISPPDGSLTNSVTFGCFINDHTLGNSYFDSWYDPEAPLIDQVGAIENTLKEAVDSTDLRDLKIFYTLYGSFQLDQVRFNSDLGNVNSVKIFGTQLDTTLNSFRSQLIDYSAALNQMSEAYVDEIQNAETPEQGEYITSVYIAKQLTLHHTAMQQAAIKLDGAISDADLDKADDYYNREDELLGEFSLQQMEDLVNYQEWFNLLNAGEADVYKSIFDWFFNTSSFRFFIVVPIMMGLVSIVLATRIRSRSEGDSS